jgi:murein DD-endopeptidase MepM/ murein hydrolase activator NlpD
VKTVSIKLQYMPLENMDIKITGSALYGWRIHPVYKKKAFHYGIDRTAPLGTPIHAAADGKVIVSKMQGNGKGAGNYIVIDHGGWYTYYAHQSERKAKTGQKVKAGDIIGYAGSTGDSTGNHLHFGICTKFIPSNINAGDWTDPLPYLKEISEEENDMDEATVKNIIKKEAEGSRNTPSDFAKNAVPWAVKKGYLSDDKNLDGTITKEELATVLYRVLGGK